MSKPSLRALRLFEVAFLPWMRRRIESVCIEGLSDDLRDGLPLLLVANHVSWWDGFALREVHRLLRPAAPLRVVMTEAELRRNRVLGRIAAVPIRPGSPGSVLRTFRGLRSLREERPDAVVLFFPQGRIWPSTRRPLGFERGVATLARVLAPVRVVPIGLHIEPLAAMRPTIFVSAGSSFDVPAGGRVDPLLLQDAVEHQIDGILSFLARHGEDSARAWPGPFGSLPTEPRPGASALPFRPRLRLVGEGDTNGREDV